MSAASRMRFWLNAAFQQKPDGMTWEELCEVVADFEYTRGSDDWKRLRGKISGDVARAMRLAKRPIRDRYQLDRPRKEMIDKINEFEKDGSYLQYLQYYVVRWRFKEGKYFWADPEEFRKIDERSIQIYKREGIERYVRPWPSGGYESVILILRKVFSENEEGLTFDELVEELRSFYKDPEERASESAEKNVIEAMGFAYKPIKEWYFQDKIDTSHDSFFEFYPDFTNWIFHDGRYYPYDRSELTEGVRDATVESTVRKVLAGQMRAYAVTQHMSGFDFLRMYAQATAQIKEQGFDDFLKDITR